LALKLLYGGQFSADLFLRNQTGIGK